MLSYLIKIFIVQCYQFNFYQLKVFPVSVIYILAICKFSNAGYRFLNFMIVKVFKSFEIADFLYLWIYEDNINCLQTHYLINYLFFILSTKNNFKQNTYSNRLRKTMFISVLIGKTEIVKLSQTSFCNYTI